MSDMMLWTDISSDETTRVGRSVTVNVARRAELMADLEHRLLAGRGFSLATLNLDHVVKLQRDPEFRTAYLDQSHVTADGNPIVWLSRLAGSEVELIPGSELIDPVAEMAAAHDLPIAFLGSTAATLQAAGEALERRFAGLRVVSRIAPPMGFVPDGPDADRHIAELVRSGARLCFVALGAPKQEIFVAHAQKGAPQIGFLSIGAGLDFISGAQKRAPDVVRRLAAEWLWRLMLDPRRLAARYGACIAVLPGLATHALRTRRRATRRSA
jgi:N-acetylglucosaminyldiphosphoundecaprenol N-acetyl-beta-D-mannosaminyltransferase